MFNYRSVLILILLTTLGGLADERYANGILKVRPDGLVQWPNGDLVERLDGTTQFPNGLVVTRLDGQQQFPSGNLVCRARGERQYPNGALVVRADGTVQYPSGFILRDRRGQFRAQAGGLTKSAPPVVVMDHGPWRYIFRLRGGIPDTESYRAAYRDASGLIEFRVSSGQVSDIFVTP